LASECGLTIIAKTTKQTHNFAMTKRRSKKIDAADVLPPEDDAAQSAASKKAAKKPPNDATLRMPPLIDHAQQGGLARAKHYLGVLTSLAPFGSLGKKFSIRVGEASDNLTAALGRVAQTFLAMLRWFLYRVSLLLLIGATLGLAGFAVFQSRDMAFSELTLPDVTALWQSAPDANDEALDVPSREPQTSLKQDPNKEPIIEDENIGASNLPTASVLAPEPDRSSAFDGGLILQQERAAHEATRLALVGAQEQLATALQTQTDDTAVLSKNQAQNAKKAKSFDALKQRALLAELLVRLQSGSAFAPLLEVKPLQASLTSAQLEALALYANTGVPTQASLAAQAKSLWLAAASGEPSRAGLSAGSAGSPGSVVSLGSATSGEPAPEADTKADLDNMPAFLQWLRARAGGLVDVQVKPQASAELASLSLASARDVGPSDDLRQIYQFILVGDYRAASTKTRTAILRLDALPPQANRASNIESLQALYADLRAHGEVTPILHQLRKDFLATDLTTDMTTDLSAYSDGGAL
jgi:hypothetical protein